MSTTNAEAATRPGGQNGYMSGSDSGNDGQASGGRMFKNNVAHPPSSNNLNRPAGNIVKGAVNDDGSMKTAALLLGIKLDLEAEIHLTARIRGDITIGLY